MHQSCKHFGAFQRHSQPSHVAKPSVTEVKVSYVLVQCPVCATNCRGCPVGVETAWCHLVMPQPGMHVLFDLLGCLLCGCIIPVEGHKFSESFGFFSPEHLGEFPPLPFVSFDFLLAAALQNPLLPLCFQPPFFWVCFLAAVLAFFFNSFLMGWLWWFSLLCLCRCLWMLLFPRAPVHGHPLFPLDSFCCMRFFQPFEALPMLSCRLPKHRHQMVCRCPQPSVPHSSFGWPHSSYQLCSYQPSL